MTGSFLKSKRDFSGDPKQKVWQRINFPFYVTFKDQECQVSSSTGFFKDIRSGIQLTERVPARQVDWRQKVSTPKYKKSTNFSIPLSTILRWLSSWMSITLFRFVDQFIPTESSKTITQTDQGKNQMKTRSLNYSHYCAGFCGPEKESCVASQILKDKYERGWSKIQI